jgi:RNA polymerase sigma-70 factor (ECF subfamily)
VCNDAGATKNVQPSACVSRQRSENEGGDRSELDALTLQRARRGDHAAFRKLVERYHRPTFALLWRMLEHSRSQQDIEDLVQETFLRVFRALERFDPAGGARLSTWILTIGTRLALNELRRGNVVTLRLPNGVELPGHERADALLRRRRLRQAIRAALEQLSPRYRAVVVLREYHGFSYEEIAEATGLELNTVKSRMARGRAALRAALKEVRDV